MELCYNCANIDNEEWSNIITQKTSHVHYYLACALSVKYFIDLHGFS